jgi:hypothetical protein
VFRSIDWCVHSAERGALSPRFCRARLRNTDFKTLRVKGTSPNVDVTCVTQSSHVDFVEWHVARAAFCASAVIRSCFSGMLAMIPFSDESECTGLKSSPTHHRLSQLQYVV